jgi:hypothetical protein
MAAKTENISLAGHVQNCAWEFIPAVWPAGDSIIEMKQNYERLRDKEFGAHVCAKHPKS